MSPSDFTRLNVCSGRRAVRVTPAQRIIEVPDDLSIFCRFCMHFPLRAVGELSRSINVARRLKPKTLNAHSDRSAG